MTNLNLAQANIIVQVMDKKAVKDKYKVAVIKRPVEFSKETYSKAYNEFSQFIASNPTLEKMVANAEDAGYKLLDRNDLYSSEHGIGGIRGTKEALRWAFSAKTGEVSGLYECGESDRMLVVGHGSIVILGILFQSLCIIAVVCFKFMLIFLQTRIQILIRNCHFTFIQQIIFNCADTCLRLGICGLLFEYLPYICNQILFRGDLLLGKCICYHVIGQRVHGNRLINSLDFEFKRCFLSRQIRRLVILRECHIRTYFFPDFCADKPITESINVICLLCGITLWRAEKGRRRCLIRGAFAC